MSDWRPMRSLPLGAALLLAITGGCSRWDASNRPGVGDAERHANPTVASRTPAVETPHGGYRIGPPAPAIPAVESQQPVLTVQQVQPMADLSADQPDQSGRPMPQRLPPIAEETATPASPAPDASGGAAEKSESLDAAFARMRQAAVAMKGHGQPSPPRSRTRLASEAPAAAAEPVRLPTVRR